VNADAERLGIEQQLSGSQLGFSETYVRVGQLKHLLDGGHASATDHTVSVLADLLASDRHHAQTQAYHLFGTIAGTLATIGCRRENAAVSRRALQVLVPAATGTRGERQRASAETVGSLPVKVKGPGLPVDGAGTESPRRSLQSVLARLGASGTNRGAYLGRSFVAPLDGKDEVAVIKISRRGESYDGLLREAQWMDHLIKGRRRFDGRFIIPRPLKLKGGFLFRPARLPGPGTRTSGIDPSTAAAIAFTVHRDYFVYPNDHRPGTLPAYARFHRILERAAGLFGELAAAGIVHTAPIPLFHNRVQRDRRDDGGLYEWDRAGRLDRWLGSSRFPNFGPTGIRDFEHLASLGEKEGRRLYRHIGNHLLSLILVAGSYFRHKAPERIGVDEQGAPVDARDLFDRDQFSELVQGVFAAYHNGFARCKPAVDLGADIDSLVVRLIDAMGVDRHMREMLRQADQNRMSAADFSAYLARYHLPAGDDPLPVQGAADIEIPTGPHLGEFNGPISVPELTAFLRSAAAAIVAGRFMGQWFSDEQGVAHG
jgi:hypothetical protein